MRFHQVNPAAYLNFLRAQHAQLKGEVLLASYPYYLVIEATSICQLRCPSCPTGIENESRRTGTRQHLRSRQAMKGELLDALLDELGDYLFQVMFYNWGEPLLNRELPGFIRRARERGIATEIHTNLSLHLSDKVLEELLASGLDVLAASVDGFSQETYQIYRRGGDLALVRSNLERLVALRQRLGARTEIVWNMLVFRFNEHELDAAEGYCRDLGVTFKPREAFIDNPDWVPSHRRNPPPSPAPEAAPAATPGPPRPCAWHYGYSTINANGSVSPCCAVWEEAEDFGVVEPHRVDFAEVWNNSLFRKSRAAFAGKPARGLEEVETICTRCPYGTRVQSLYNPLDAEVFAQYQRAFGGQDALLETAFELLAADPARFVRFYEANERRLHTAPGQRDRAVYPHVRDRLRPYVRALSRRYPRLYTWGKALESRLYSSARTMGAVPDRRP
jgi:MoaA/NifB/PqqE/SkfB family radical SAM enzyme